MEVGFDRLNHRSTQGFGMGEGVRVVGWWSTDSVTDSRTGTDGGRFRQGFDTASLVNHQLNPRLRGGGGCPCGGEKPSTNENREFTNGRRAIRAFVKNSWMVSQCGGHFGVGEGVRAGYNNHY